MRDLSDLIARVETASGPDRELDLAINLAFFPDGEIANLQKFRRGFDGKPGMSWEIRGRAVCFEKYTDDGRCTYNGGIPLPDYTASIDAALALVERCLPGWHYALRQRVYRQPPVYECELQCWRETEYGVAPSAPLAILLALLRALPVPEEAGVELETTAEERAELRRLALAATPGPWTVLAEDTEDGRGKHDGYEVVVVSDQSWIDGKSIVDTYNSSVAEIHEELDEDSVCRWDEAGRKNTAFIAGANPKEVLALLRDIDRLLASHNDGERS